MNYKRKGLTIITLVNIVISGTIFLLPKDDQFYIFHNFAYSDYSAFYCTLTYSVIHSSLNHLSSNMLFLIVYGYFLEPIIGTKKFFCLYVAGAILSVVAYQLIMGLSIPCVGASGAVCAVLGASLFLKKIPKTLILLLVFFMVTEVVKSLMGVKDGIAHLAHVMGFTVGLLFMFIIYGK